MRIAAAVAQPFHIESSPIRVTPKGTHRGDGDGNRVGQARPIEAQDLARTACRADAGKHPLIPALQRDLIGHPAEGLIGGDDRRDRGTSPVPLGVGDGEHRGDHVAGMARAPGGVGVVAVQVADQDGVREGRQIGRCRLPRAEDARRRLALHARGQAAGDGRGLGVERAGRAA
jgi:hypothetical protein